MNALDCTDIKALLSALIDDQLDAHTRHQVERHLAQCETCCAQINEYERLESLVAMSAELALHGQPDLPRGFENEVLARTVRASAPSYSIFRGVVTWTGWCAAAASIALAAFIWVVDQRPVHVPNVAIGGQDVTAAPRQHEPEAHRTRLPSYATGMNLQSTVFEGPFDTADELRPPSSTILGDPVRAPMFDEWSYGFATGEARHYSRFGEPGYREPVYQPGHLAARSVPAISRDEADSLYSVSLLMHVLADADLTTFADVEGIRRVVLADDLIERLSETRERVDAADRPALLAAEAVLVRVVEGPLDREDVRHMSETVARLDLSGEIGSITDRWDRASSL